MFKKCEIAYSRDLNAWGISMIFFIKVKGGGGH